MTGQSLHEGPDRSLCEAVKVKPGLCWKLQDVRGAGDMGCLPRREANRERNHPKRKVCCRHQRWKDRAISALYTRNKTTGFGVCSSGFQSCFGTVFPYYATMAPLRNGSLYTVPLYGGSTYFAFDFVGVKIKRLP